MQLTRLLLVAYILISPLSAVAESSPDQIRQYSRAITEYSHGMLAHKVEGSNVDEMLRDLAIRIKGTDESEFRLIHDQMPQPDEETGQYGKASIDALFETIISHLEQNVESPEILAEAPKKIRGLLLDLARSGAHFAYTSDGSSVCGITFPSPLIIDLESNVVYELLMVGGPC